jgi:hypothetical protein
MTQSEAIDKAYDRLSALSHEEFMKKLEGHEIGWIGNFILDMGGAG